MSVTARDVARVAGVSASTVSRALAKPETVSPGTRNRVLETARGMGYRLHLTTRAPGNGHRGNLGLIVPDLENPFFAGFAKGVQAKARAAGYALIVADSDEDPSEEGQLVRDLTQQVHGMVLCSPRAPDHVITRLAQEGPLVLVNRPCGDIPSVTIDNAEGIRLAVAHLRALGHGTICYVGGPSTSWSSTQRLAGLHEAAARHSDIEIVDLGSFEPYVTGGVAAGDLVIASGATAVIAYNDLIAAGILTRLRQRGVRVPQDMSVVGVDDIPMSALTTPTLTSVGISQVNCGRAAVDMLLSLARDPSTPPVHHHDLSFRLAVRESTGSAPASHTPT